MSEASAPGPREAECGRAAARRSGSRLLPRGSSLDPYRKGRRGPRFAVADTGRSGRGDRCQMVGNILAESSARLRGRAACPRGGRRLTQPCRMDTPAEGRELKRRFCYGLESLPSFISNPARQAGSTKP